MSEEKKIIVDEDWKTQVQAERDAKEASAEDKDVAAPTDGTEAPAEAMQMPPASFEMLLTSLTTEAMMSMGKIPHPVTGESMKNLDQAKYLIDMIGVLKDKTRGNLSNEEANGLTELLHQVRMLFVDAQKSPTEPSIEVTE